LLLLVILLLIAHRRLVTVGLEYGFFGELKEQDVDQTAPAAPAFCVV
jgi:hypothetical protein